MSEQQLEDVEPVVPFPYWESRLDTHFDFRGVGNIGLKPAFNRWLYLVKGRVFRRQVSRYLPNPAGAAVLDVGSGIGFVLEQWHRLGCPRVMGSDLTNASVERLRARYGDASFLQVDIGASDPEELKGQASSRDAVSMLDVAYHLMTDEAYVTALTNVRNVLKPGGIFIFSERFATGEKIRRRHHTVFRPWSLVSQWLDDVGFEVIGRHPQYVFMERPTDFGWSLPAISWRIVCRVARSSRIGAWLAGAFLAPVDLLATRIVRRGPSLEMVVCRRK